MDEFFIFFLIIIFLPGKVFEIGFLFSILLSFIILLDFCILFFKFIFIVFNMIVMILHKKFTDLL